MDKISGLPDELLVKILSNVPTKVAVSTSILSKRWEHLWMWLPKLEYHDHHYSASQCKMLRSFLEKNMPLHKAPIIERLRLKLSYRHFKPETIKLMAVVAVSRNVCELDISYSSRSGKWNVLPSNLYMCKSLVILKLDDMILLHVPSMVCLPSLKTLQLQRVRYYNEESLQRLLSICPVLEDLLVELRDNDDNMRKFTIIVPTLNNISLYIPYFYDIDGYVINTPSLKYFKLTDHNNESHYCLIENMPNLIEAYLDVEFHDMKSLIRSITYVKRLTMCSKVVYDDDDGVVFNNLEHLKLCRCKENSSNLLVQLLKDSPNLRVLDIFEINDHFDDGFVCWREPSTVPECMLSSLQTFNWSMYTGKQEERDCALYILKNATQLKTTIISSEEYDVPRDEMIKEFALCSTASATCQLFFI